MYDMHKNIQELRTVKVAKPALLHGAEFSLRS